jgi:hypothetical protein
VFIHHIACPACARSLACRGSPWAGLDGTSLLCDSVTHDSWCQPPNHTRVLGGRPGSAVFEEEPDQGENVFMTTWTNDDVSTCPISIQQVLPCMQQMCLCMYLQLH